jgi:hypothetical protein
MNFCMTAFQLKFFYESRFFMYFAISRYIILCNSIGRVGPMYKLHTCSNLVPSRMRLSSVQITKTRHTSQLVTEFDDISVLGFPMFSISIYINNVFEHYRLTYTRTPIYLFHYQVWGQKLDMYILLILTFKWSLAQMSLYISIYPDVTRYRVPCTNSQLLITFLSGIEYQNRIVGTNDQVAKFRALNL